MIPEKKRSRLPGDLRLSHLLIPCAKSILKKIARAVIAVVVGVIKK
jgi:hypothetical protein